MKVMTAGQALNKDIVTVLSCIPDDLKNSIAKKFDWVLYDTAPVNSYPDTFLEIKLADGIILAVRAEKSNVAQVKKAKESLESVGARILGGVLNDRRHVIPKFIYNRL